MSYNEVICQFSVQLQKFKYGPEDQYRISEHKQSSQDSIRMRILIILQTGCESEIMEDYCPFIKT